MSKVDYKDIKDYNSSINLRRLSSSESHVNGKLVNGKLVNGKLGMFVIGAVNKNSRLEPTNVELYG